jgi:hypothetical protein
VRFVIGALLGLVVAMTIVFHESGSRWLQMALSQPQYEGEQDSPAMEAVSHDRATESVLPTANADGRETAPESVITEDVITESAITEGVSSERVRSESVSFERATDTDTETGNENAAALAPQPSRSAHKAWSAFRSETSAAGFAAQLTRQLKREFTAVKLGPGKYEVRFYFDSNGERDEILREIADMTGFYPGEQNRALLL